MFHVSRMSLVLLLVTVCMVNPFIITHQHYTICALVSRVSLLWYTRHNHNLGAKFCCRNEAVNTAMFTVALSLCLCVCVCVADVEEQESLFPIKKSQPEKAKPLTKARQTRSKTKCETLSPEKLQPYTGTLIDLDDEVNGDERANTSYWSVGIMK